MSSEVAENTMMCKSPDYADRTYISVLVKLGSIVANSYAVTKGHTVHQ